MKERKLEVLLGERLVGTMAQTADRRVAFAYSEEWLDSGFAMDNAADVEQMYRRMCFNVFAHNRDDHAKNFSWLYDEHVDCWHPSPAYDLTWSTTYFGEHTTTVDGNGENPGLKELLAVGKAAGMARNTCREIAEEIREKTKGLEKKYRGMRS